MSYTSIIPGGKAGSVAALTATFATEATLTGGINRGPMSGIRVSGFAYWSTCNSNNTHNQPEVNRVMKLEFEQQRNTN